MNRKIEDIKISIKKQPKAGMDSIPVLNIENHNPTHDIKGLKSEDIAKYDFLNKKNQKTTYSNQRISKTPHLKTKKRLIGRKIISLLFISLLIGGTYLFSTKFLQSKVIITAKNKSFELKNQKFTAERIKLNNVIPFELMVVSDSDYKDIVLTSSMEVSNKAKGEITLYNEYSTKVQKISAGSFISDENGKTYKTDTTISIPGYKTDTTKKIIPGEISVGVTAFISGEAYNGNPQSFSINSFKGTDKYKKIYGKIKTPLSGGMTGLVYNLDEEQKADVSSKVSNLKDKLTRKLNAQIPPGYVLYDDSISFSSEIPDGIISKTPDTRIELKGSMSAFILKENDLSDSIIDKLLPNISSKEKSEITLSGISDLSFNFSNKNQLINKEIDSFDFELTGKLNFKWNPYTEELKASLVGMNRDAVYPVFKKDPGISSAIVKIIPFWSKRLPSNVNNINIVIK